VARNPPRESADRVRALHDQLTAARREEETAKEALYRATYEASLDGWSDRALGKAIGVPYRTVQDWREIGRSLEEQ
jgi:hypothetical protein